MKNQQKTVFYVKFNQQGLIKGLQRCQYQIQIFMFQQVQNDAPQRKTISFKTGNSKSIIRIQKSKLLPPNFFKPLTIDVEPSQNSSLMHEQIIATPCFGMHSDKEVENTEKFKILQPKQKIDKEQFYSWFSKGMKSLSSRVQTVPVEMETSVEKKRHLTERKGRIQRVKSVQEQGAKSTFKMFKKYENLLSDKMEMVSKPESAMKFKLKPPLLEGIEKSYKNHFKVNNSNKRGYVEAKYKQNKALNSINAEKQAGTFLPFISNG